METNLLPFLVWDEQLDAAFESIANGNYSDGHIILSHVVHKMDSGNTPDTRAIKFVIEAFKEILIDYEAGSSVDFSKAFRMQSEKGRPPLSAKGRYKRALQYGGEVAQLMNAGITNNIAIEEVSKKYKRSMKNIQDYYTLFNKIVAG